MKGLIPRIIFAVLCHWAVSFHGEALASEVLFSNGVPTLGYGIDLSRYQQAEDFSLPNTSLVESFKLWTLEGFDTRDGIPFDGHIDYWIYGNVSGKPSANPLAHGIGQSVIRDDLGIQDNLSGPLHCYATTFALEQPFLANEQTSYFIAVHFLNSYPLPFAEIYWSTAMGPVAGAPSHGREGKSLSGTWSDNSQGVIGAYGAGRLAVEVIGYAVPESNSCSMILLGACGLLMPSRRLRRPQVREGDCR